MERVLNGLRLYGLSDIEARVLISLADIGPVRVSALARKLGVNRMRVYRILRKLQERGLVDSILGRPVKFVAIPIDEALDLLIKNAKKKVSEMEEKRFEIIKTWSSIRVSRPETPEPRFRINQGRKNIYASLTKIFQEAEKEIDLVVTGNELYRMLFAGLDDALKECSQRNIEIKIVTKISERSIKAVKSYLSYASVRHTLLSGNMRFVIVDEKEVLTSVVMDDSISLETKRDIGLWTDSKDYVQAMKVFFDELWTNAFNANDVIKAIESGKTIEEVRIIREIEEYMNNYRRMMTSSSSEVLLFTGNIRNFEMLPASLKLLEDLSNRSISIKVLTPITRDNMLEVERLSKYVQVKHIDPPLKTEFLVVDRREILLSFSLEEAGDFRRYLWSNIKNHSEFMASVFEEFWTRGLSATLKLEELKAWKSFEENLEALRPILESRGWILETSGEVIGKSGTLHKFDLIIMKTGNSNKIVIGDFLANPNEAIKTIMAMRMKSLDVKPLNQVLFTSGVTLNKEERELAKFYKIRVLKAENLKINGLALLKKIIPRRFY